MELDDPAMYGRIVRDADGAVDAHRRGERRDATTRSRSTK